MEPLNKLKEETYQNYIHQYPHYKNSFHDLIEKDDILYKIWYYTYLPPEEIELRKKIEKEIKGEHYHYLLQKVTRDKKEELESLFDDYGVVKLSDYIYLKLRAANTPLTITRIRQKLTKVESKTYNKNGKTISERKIYRYYPLAITERDISVRKRKVGV